MIEHLPSKCKGLSSNFNTLKKKKKEQEHAFVACIIVTTFRRLMWKYHLNREFETSLAT